MLLKFCDRHDLIFKVTERVCGFHLKKDFCLFVFFVGAHKCKKLSIVLEATLLAQFKIVAGASRLRVLTAPMRRRHCRQEMGAGCDF